MIDFTRDEQITIIALVDTTIEDLSKSLNTGSEDFQICYASFAETVISCLQSIREKINEERRCQGRAEL